MEKRKNKIPKKALAFASALIIVLSLFSTIAFAQGPYFSIMEYSTPYTNIFVYDLTSTYCLANVQITYNNSQPVSFNTINILYSEYFYENIYTGNSGNDVDYLLDNNFNYKALFNGGSANKNAILNNLDFLSLLENFLSPSIPVGNYDTYYNAFELSYDNQFTYWLNRIQNAKDVAFDNGFAEGNQSGLQTGYNNGYTEGYDIGLDEGLLLGYDQGYEVGFNDGKPIGYSNGYTQAVKDMDAFERGLYDIFNAPFIFVKNISTFEIFGVNLLWILSGILLLCLGFILIKFIGGALPL